MSVLYHRDIGFPKWLKMKPVTVSLTYGSHSREEALSDRYGVINLPKRITIRPEEIFEIEMVNNKPVKIALRTHHDVLNDIIIVLNTKDNFVKTVWLNRKTDTHKTLDRTKYKNPIAA